MRERKVRNMSFYNVCKLFKDFIYFVIFLRFIIKIINFNIRNRFSNIFEDIVQVSGSNYL